MQRANNFRLGTHQSVAYTGTAGTIANGFDTGTWASVDPPPPGRPMRILFEKVRSVIGAVRQRNPRHAVY